VLPWRQTSAWFAEISRQGERMVQRLAFALERERAQALGLFQEMAARSAEQREILVGNSPRFQTWGFYELLVDRSWEECTRNPAQAEELALLALKLSLKLDLDVYPEELVEDLRSRSWSHIGNSRRLRSDLRGAEEAFQKAYLHLKRGTGEPLERGNYLDLKASLWRDLRRFDDAIRLLQRAKSLFLAVGDDHRAGRALMSLSIVYSQAARPEQAIPVLYRALGVIDGEQDLRLLLFAKHNLMGYLADAGRPLEAQALYRETRALYRSFPDPFIRNRRSWLKGKISRGLGDLEQAESLFLAARDGFIAEGVPYDTALVSLELATLYAEQGRIAELRRLTDEMIPIFTSRQIHREALAALSFLCRSMEAERASAEGLARVAAYLRRAQYDPAQKFEDA
jgi:tetratricopeptide (TPR) repeat protein